MKTLNLKISYSIPEKVISELDKAIIKALKSIDYSWYAQGYDFTTGQRYLCFDKLKKS